MTEVSFYVLSPTEASARWPFVCQLVKKTYELGLSSLIYTRDRDSCQQLDHTLWQDPASFLPHAVLPCPANTPIQLGYGELSGELHQVLINVSDQVPTFFSRFERVAEVICNEPAILAASRERYKFYRDRGYNIQTHKLQR